MFSTKKILITGLLFYISLNLFCETFFSGIAGGIIKVKAEQNAENNIKPAVLLDAYLSGQANFSQNVWSRISFSLQTDNLMENAPFGKTTSLFQVDEVSFTIRQKIDSFNNYFSLYMGNYEPIGSDLFLTRQFGISPISSRITETWQNVSGNLLFNQSGFGLCDIMRFKGPVALGIYAYMNNTSENTHSVNTDFRLGGTQRFLTFDINLGLGAPVAKGKYDDVLFAVEKINWHTGATFLIGNYYTSSLFIQGGILKGLFTTGQGINKIDKDDIYFLIEPRFTGKTVKTHLSFFFLPPETVSSLFFVNGQLGANLNIFTDKLRSRNTGFDMGLNTGLTFNNLTLNNLETWMTSVKSMDFQLYVTPYISAKIAEGEINSMVSLNVMGLISSKIQDSVTVNIGYKSSF